MKREDKVLFLDIFTAARNIVAFTKDLSPESFAQSKLHQSAVIRDLQVIGAAARQVSEEGRRTYPQIAWIEIAGMRNRIIHEYFRVSLRIIWKTVQDDVPLLMTAFAGLFPITDDDGSEMDDNVSET